MSPNDMLDNWGVLVLLHAKGMDYAFLRAAAGKKVVDGRRLEPSQAFKALALAPTSRLCVGARYLIHLPRLQHRRGPAPRTPGTRPRPVVGASEDSPRHRRYAPNHLRRIPCPGTPRSRQWHISLTEPSAMWTMCDRRRGARAPWPGPRVQHGAHRPHRTQPTAKRLRRNGHPLRLRNKTSWRAAWCARLTRRGVHAGSALDQHRGRDGRPPSTRLRRRARSGTSWPWVRPTTCPKPGRCSTSEATSCARLPSTATPFGFKGVIKMSLGLAQNSARDYHKT